MTEVEQATQHRNETTVASGDFGEPETPESESPSPHPKEPQDNAANLPVPTQADDQGNTAVPHGESEESHSDPRAGRNIETATVTGGSAPAKPPEIEVLFSDTKDYILYHTNVTERAAASTAFWVAMTYFPEVPIRPVLLLTGAEADATHFLMVLETLCIDNVLMVGFDRSSIGRYRRRTTLLVYEPNLDKRTATLLAASPTRASKLVLRPKTSRPHTRWPSTSAPELKKKHRTFTAFRSLSCTRKSVIPWTAYAITANCEAASEAIDRPIWQGWEKAILLLMQPHAGSTQRRSLWGPVCSTPTICGSAHSTDECYGRRGDRSAGSVCNRLCDETCSRGCR